MSEKQFIGGLYPRAKHDNAPDYVIGKLSINVAQFREWMQAYLRANPSEEWISVDMKVSQGGKGYAELDTWKPTQQNTPPAAAPAAQQDDFEDSDIPF